LPEKFIEVSRSHPSRQRGRRVYVDLFRPAEQCFATLVLTHLLYYTPPCFLRKQKRGSKIILTAVKKAFLACFFQTTSAKKNLKKTFFLFDLSLYAAKLLVLNMPMNILGAQED
jgi:hypothetical protein